MGTTLQLASFALVNVSLYVPLLTPVLLSIPTLQTLGSSNLGENFLRTLQTIATYNPQQYILLTIAYSIAMQARAAG